MFKRDLITAEVQKLSLILTKIMGLKVEDPLFFANKVKDAIAENFNLNLHELQLLNKDQLLKKFKSSNLNAQQLDMLIKFIIPLLDKNSENPESLKYLLLNIYSILEINYKFLSLENYNHAKELNA